MIKEYIQCIYSFGWLLGPLLYYYSQIHPALQQIPAHSTLELCDG